MVQQVCWAREPPPCASPVHCVSIVHAFAAIWDGRQNSHPIKDLARRRNGIISSKNKHTQQHTHMIPEAIGRHATRVSRWAAIALGASIPVSTALDNVLLAIVLLAWLVSGQAQNILKFSLKNNKLLYPVLLFGLLAVGTLYGESPRSTALSYLWKYSDLLFIHVLAMVFQQREARVHALHAFAITIAIILLISCLIRLGIFPLSPLITGTLDEPTVFKLRITHGMLVAFGAFLFAWLGMTATRLSLRIVWFGFAVLAVINVLLLTKSATAYLMLGLLIVLFGWERTGWKGIAIAATAVIVIVVSQMMVPSAFRARIYTIQKEIPLWLSGDVRAVDTSAGQRLEFYKNTVDIIAAHPLTGVGTGGLPQAYAQQVKGTGKPETHNPHNEFLNITAQIGIAGLLVLIAMFWMQWRTARQLATPMEQALARGLVLTLVSGCLVNSLLLDHAEGLFYAWMSGLLYGGLKYPPDKLPAQT